jgi:predicted transcriptional regulator
MDDNKVECLAHEEWFVRQVQAGLADHRSGGNVPHEEVMTDLRRRISNTQ